MKYAPIKKVKDSIVDFLKDDERVYAFMSGVATFEGLHDGLSGNYRKAITELGVGTLLLGFSYNKEIFNYVSTLRQNYNLKKNISK